jgi:hypothetical protein
MMSDAAALKVSAEVEQWFVTPTWVANHYKVSRLSVHRAIASRRLVAARVEGGGRWGWVLDRRLLPAEFPR